MNTKVRTINGKTFEEIQKLLKERFEFIGSVNGKKFLHKDLVDERLDEILGLNYSFDLKDKLELIQIGPSYDFVGAGTLSVYDDDGNLVLFRTSGGGSSVAFSKNAPDTPVDISSTYSSAVSSIKKKCAKEIALGRYLSIEAKQHNFIRDTKSPNPSSISTPSSNVTPQNVENATDNSGTDMFIKLLSKFTSYTSCMKADVVNTESGECKKLVVWNKDIQRLGETVIKKLTKYNVDTILHVSAKAAKWKQEEQYVLETLRAVKSA